MPTAKSRPAFPSRKRVSTRKPIPPLENGDHLTRDEFERRYEAMPHVKKAELIEGVVYMGSPVSVDHAHPQLKMATWLGTYSAHTPFVLAADNATVRLDLKNEPQPDLFLVIDPKAGGQSTWRKYVEGAPELVVEIALSSVSNDMHDKLLAYRRNGVKEYIVWRVAEAAIDWMVLEEGRYVLRKPTEGLQKSTVFAGLWLDVKAMLAGDLAKVLAVLQQGLADPAHAAFVKQLHAAAKSKA